jgi:HEAT repeat protein/energy-coupling factor transporter ATP-binding protein EcfA2
MSDFDFQPYRDFILLDGDKQRALYTPTDALLPLQVGMVAQGEQTDSSQERVVEQLPVLDGLRKYALGDQREHVILAGRPGSGKSTALQQLRLALATEGLVPVLVQLKGDRSVPEMIQGEFRRAKQRVTLEQIDDWLLAGSETSLQGNQLVLLLDGVNEIPTDDLRRDLATFREQNSTVPMIFTTRDLALGGDLGISRRLEMKPLTVLQMQKFVGQRLPDVGGKLLEQLSDRLREIAETPLLLKMLCNVFGTKGQIPENKGELFRWFDQEYDNFKGRPPVSEDSRRFKSEILQHLAFVMMTGDPSKPTEFWLTIDRGVAEREIEKFLRERQESDAPSKSKEWLEDLLEYHLLQVAADASQVEFHHQLFQEYYAAEKLLSMFYDDHSDIAIEQRFQHFYLNYLKWTEVIGFMMSQINNESSAIKIVELALNVDLALGAYLAGQARLDFQTHLINTIDQKRLRPWLEIYLLGRTHSSAATKKLLNYLDNSDLDIAIDSVLALKSLNDLQSVSALQTRLDNLEKWVSSDDFPVSNYTPEPGCKILSSKAERLEIEILQLLAELSPKSIQAWVDNYIIEPDSYIYILTMRPEMSRIVILYAKKSGVCIERQMFLILQESDNVNKINQLAGILAELGSESATEVLTEKIKNTCDHQLLKAIINALSKFNNEKSSKALAELVSYPDYFVRCDAAKVIVDDQRVDAIPTLEGILKNADFYIRWHAATVLTELGVDIAFEILAEGLDHENHEVREKSVKSLDGINSEGKKDLLINKLIDQSYFVRRRAAIILAKFGYENAIPELLEALFDYRPDDPNLANAFVDFEWPEMRTIRIEGFNTLGKLGDENAIKRWILEQKSGVRREIIYEVVTVLSHFINTKIVREKLYRSSIQI